MSEQPTAQPRPVTAPPGSVAVPHVPGATPPALPTAPPGTGDAPRHPGPVPAAGVAPAVPRRAGPLSDLLDLVLPATCAGCEAPGPVLCADCATGWLSAPVRCEQDAGRLDRLDGRGALPVWTQAVYQGAVRRTVIAWKDRGRAELTGWLAGRTGQAAAGLSGELPDSPPLLVVPAPPSAAGRRRRGEDLLRPLAAAAAAALTAHGVPARAAAYLRTGHRHRDQVGRGRRGRGMTLAGGVRLRRSAGRDPAFARGGHPVLLIDDVLTTGATLAACREILDRAGQRVVGALTLAATPAPTHGVAGVESRAAPG